MKIEIYSKSNCPNCNTVRNFLQAHGLKFTETKIDNDAERLKFYERCGPSVRQMPQVFIDDQRVGGLVGLQQALVPPEPITGATVDDPCPDCGKQLAVRSGGGVGCSCGYWFCF